MSPEPQAALDVIESAPLVVKEAKAGYKTTEFWVALGGAILTQLGALHLPGKYGDTVATVALVVSYIVSRGVAKAGVAQVEPSSVALRPDVEAEIAGDVEG